MKNLPSTLPSEAQLYLENLLQQSLAIHHGILSGNIEQTTTLHADFFTRSFQDVGKYHTSNYSRCKTCC